MAGIKGYNGWTNYETWVANLWVGIEESYWSEAANEEVEAVKEGMRAPYIVVSERGHAVHRLAERMEREIVGEDRRDDLPVTGMFADLLTNAIGRINWFEIARSWLEDAEGYEDLSDTYTDGEGE